MLVWVVEKHNIVFYDYDRYIAGRNPIWLQKTMMVLVRMFERFGLQKKLGKANAMVCLPSFILWHQRDMEYIMMATRDEATFREKNCTRLN